MKHVLKIFLVFFVVTLASPAFSQTLIGVQAGVNFANQHFEDEDGNTVSDDFDPLMGFNAGIVAEFPLTSMFSFETGLLASTKGFRMDMQETIEGQQIGIEARVSLLYVDIPLKAKINFNMDNFTIFARLGPYVGMGITGRAKSELSFLGQTETDEEDINWGTTEDDDYRRLDFGATAGLGIEFLPIRVAVDYDMGLANIASVTNGTINNRVLRISVAYMF